MELWIRSQDKTRLTKVNDLYVVGYGNDWAIDGYHTNSVNEFDLGIYSTKERALEVLEDIQSLIKPKYMAKEVDTPIKGKIDVEVFPYGTIVYQMPKN